MRASGDAKAFGTLSRAKRRAVRAWLMGEGVESLAALAANLGATAVTTGVRRKRHAMRPDLGEVLKVWVARKRPRLLLKRPVPRQVEIAVPGYVLEPESKSSKAEGAPPFVRISFDTDVVARRTGRTLGPARIKIDASDTQWEVGCLASRFRWTQDGGDERTWLTAAHVLTVGTLKPNFPGPGRPVSEPTELGPIVPRSCWRGTDSPWLDAGLVLEKSKPAGLIDTVAGTISDTYDPAGLDAHTRVKIVDQFGTVQVLSYHTWSAPGEVKLKLKDGTYVEYGASLLFRGTAQHKDSGTCIFVTEDGTSKLVGILAGQRADGDLVVVPAADILSRLYDLNGSAVEFAPLS